MTLVSKTFELYGKTYTFESGELAKQATGACLVKQGDTTMLDTVVVSKERKNYDFFPLTVDFNEKMYAAGRIPGGYLKREGRPSEKATLTARMIDRPIRPSFPDGFRNEVHIVATSLVADQVNPFDVINVMGASLAMTLGGVPFEGPVSGIAMGLIQEEVSPMGIQNTVSSAIKKRGITIAELARRVDMEPELLRRSLAGTRKLTGIELVNLCHELDLEIEDFPTD